MSNAGYVGVRNKTNKNGCLTLKDLMLGVGDKSFRYYRVSIDGSSNCSCSEMRVKINGENLSLQGKTFTVLSGTFSAPYGIDKINDGIAETVNAQNMATSSTGFDVYVDFGEVVIASHILWAPQGFIDSATYNTPTTLNIFGSVDLSFWSPLSRHTSISSGYPNWNAGTYREFATGL